MKTLQHFAMAAFCLASTSLFAQFDVQLPLQYGLQQTVANPAALQDHKVTVGLASFGAGFFSPIAVNDMGEIRNGTLFIDPDQFINRLDDRGNDQRFNINIETFAFNFRHRGWQVGISHSARVNGSIDMPRGFVQLAAYGNAPFVGNEMQIMPIMNAAAYQEFAVNGAYSFWDRITVGARFKLLKGSGALTTTTADARLYTDPDFYETSIATNITLNTAGFPVAFTDTGVETGDIENFVGAGTGVGVDVGFVYRSENNLEIGLSIRDMGSINWNQSAFQHRSNGQFTFSGYEGNVFDDGGFEFDVAGTADSIISEISFNSTAQSFRTSLPTTVQGSMRYLVAPKTSLTGTLYAANANSWHTGFGVGIGQQVGEWLHVGALAGMKRGGGYLATNLLLDIFGPQFYVACDNLFAITNLNEANDAYVRFGMNLAFGKIKTQDTVKGWYDVKVEGINK